MLNNTEKIKCNWCSNTSTAKEWEDNTYKECVSREMKRAYTSILKEDAFKRKSETFYKCPVCGTWLRGCQLEITDTSDIRLLRLGREPVVQTTKGCGGV